MIADVFQKVKELGALADLAEAHELGDDALAKNLGPQSIIWVPRSDTFRRGSIRTPNAPALPRALYTREARIDVHLTAKATIEAATAVDEIRALELLLNRFISAVHSVAFGDFTLLGTSYPATEGQSVGEFGRKVILSIMFQVPVFDPNAGVKEVTVMTEQVTMTQLEPDGSGGTDDPVIAQP